MAVSANVYANALDQAFSGNINWASDTIKIALMASGYTPNLATDVHWSDISSHETSGTGYTAGGATLGSKSHTVTAANSWGTTWTASASYNYGDVVRPASGNGYIYMCDTAGTAAGSAPTWPTVVGEDVADNTVNWTCIGESITQWSSASATWSTSTITAYYAVIYDAQTGTASTEPLIALVNFGGAVSTTAATYTVAPATLGWFWMSPA
jgi:hypothetical protein